MPRVDRLSALPDNIISRILSFLPIKISVSTSILSTRWRFMWAHFPNLDFDSINHYNETRFWNIIDTVMSNPRLQSINTLCFHCSYFHANENKVEKWFAGRNINNLILCPRPHSPALPQAIFTCKTLVELTLIHCALPSFSGEDISFRRLKKLHLLIFRSATAENLPKLLSYCPVLHDFYISGCFVDDCYISSATIERLEFSSSLLSLASSREVGINAPALEYLKLHLWTTSHVSTCALTSLIEADISIFYRSRNVDEPYRLSVLDFVNRLCKVKRLKLSINVPLPCRIRSIPMFDNCTRLELDSDLRFLMKFLERADNLEILVIFRVISKNKIWEEPEQVPRCLLSRLAMVRINGFNCRKPEFSVVRYFLKNAQVLRRMEVHTTTNGIDLGLAKKLNALQKIALFKRGSKECELAFS
ncbi:F-box/RNI-like/FBD-like domains-containing protein [Striga asiatica]|uniref:F-box/RNI-like/FBD-like domains-containing protein n=1 Tax=Striga asiatica TaxID=4170 RepID=A0A5A7R841_STRAF|nr:F-box/RNI-like/FBD-like domains-containing protein [Striga asiatica]